MAKRAQLKGVNKKMIGLDDRGFYHEIEIIIEMIINCIFLLCDLYIKF